MPLFSIITPAYNSKHYIHRCIESVLSQVFTEWELIIVDDGSTDGTSSIVDAYAALDHRIHVVHQANAGWCVATNRALSLCCGDYVISLDSDNWLVSSCLGSLKEVVALHAGIDVIEFNLGLCREESHEPYAFSVTYDTPLYFANPIEIDAGISDHKISLNTHGGKAINRFLLHDLWMEGNPTGADARFIGLVFARAKSVMVLPQMLLKVAMRSSSLSHSVSLADIRLGWIEDELKLCHHYRKLKGERGFRSFPQLRNLYEFYLIEIKENPETFKWPRIISCGCRFLLFADLFLPSLPLKRWPGFLLATLSPWMYRCLSRTFR